MSYKNSPTRFYRNTRKGKIMGVCAGVADYFDVKVFYVRVAVVIGAVMTVFWPFILVYAMLGFMLPIQPDDLYEDAAEEEFWKQTRKAPDYTAAELRKRFRDVERRTAEMEAYVTSKRFKLEQELRKL